MTLPIILVGAFSQDPSVYTYATSFLSALCALGYNVISFNYRAQPTRFTSINTLLINQRLVRTCKKLNPSLMFMIKAETITPATLKKIKTNNPTLKIINFYPDNPFALWNGNSNSNVLMSLPYIDCFMSWSPALIPILKTAGCKHVCYFPFAYDPELFNQKIIISEEGHKTYRSDICFVGTWEPEREQWLTAIKHRLPNINLAIWGNMWQEHCAHSILSSSIRGKAIYGNTMIKAFQCATIVLNFIRQQNALGHNMRTFEVPASKAFLLTQWTKEQAEILFEENKTIMCFKTIDELIDKIIYFSHSQEREFLIQKSYEHVQQYTLPEQLLIYFNTCTTSRR